jgi:hypothetical protein
MEANQNYSYICGMFQIGKTIVSEDILEKEFVCNLSACKTTRSIGEGYRSPEITLGWRGWQCLVS